MQAVPELHELQWRPETKDPLSSAQRIKQTFGPPHKRKQELVLAPITMAGWIRHPQCQEHSSVQEPSLLRLILWTANHTMQFPKNCSCLRWKETVLPAIRSGVASWDINRVKMTSFSSQMTPLMSWSRSENERFLKLMIWSLGYKKQSATF